MQTKSTDVPYCVGIKVGEGDVNWLIGDAYTGFNDTIDRYYSLSEAGVTAAGSVTVSFRWMTWGPEYPCNTANKKKVVFSYLGFAVDKPTTTALQAADFEVESLAPAVNFGEKGVKFTNGMIYQNQFCPTNAATVKVDTDKHPYVYVKTNAIDVPYAVGLSVKGGEPVWFLGDANNGTTATTDGYFAIKDLVSVSGKAELTLTFRWMTWFDGYGVSSVNEKVVSFDYLGFADKPTDTELRAENFEKGGSLNIDNVADTSIKFTNAVAYTDQFCPTYTVKARVNLDETPYFHYKTNVVDVPFSIGYAYNTTDITWLVGDNYNGSTAHYDDYFNLKAALGVSGKVDVTVTFRWMTWGPNWPTTAADEKEISFDYLGFAKEITARKIDEATTLTGKDFLCESTLMTIDGAEGFTVTHNDTWGDGTSFKRTIRTTFELDVDKVPRIALTTGECSAIFDATYTDSEEGVTHYINSTDQAGWRGSYNSSVVNLQTRHGWTGKHIITLVIEYILYQSPAVSQPGTMALNIASLQLKEKETFVLSPYVTDGAVLQQNAPVTIPGTGVPNATITATLKDAQNNTVDSTNVTVGADGNFVLTLNARKGSYNKYSLTVSDGKYAVTAKNLVFGEVWLAGGQSNMEFKLGWTPQGMAMNKEDTTDEYLRGLRLDDSIPRWVTGDNLNRISTISAVAYNFAKELRSAINVPVAVVDNAVGGSSIYAWMTYDMLAKDTGLSDYVRSLKTPVGNLFAERVTPIAGINLRGFLWYQGESNCGDAPGYYRRALMLMRNEYGKLFGYQDKNSMPFIFSHLAVHRYAMHPMDLVPFFVEELDGAWHTDTENSAQIAIYDQPLEYNGNEAAAPISVIHPSNKIGVGHRMALSALSMVYNKGTEYTSPVMKSYEVRNGSIYVTFDHVGDGLKAGDKALKGFAICGENRIYVPANAEIIGTDTVRIYSPFVTKPVAATYAWAMMCNESNLLSTVGGRDGFAAVPFHTEVNDNAVHYHPHDWTYCDDEKLWRSDGDNGAWSDAWISDSGTVSFDSTNAFSGDAALKLDYTADANGVVSVRPNLRSPLANDIDIDQNYSNFDGIQLHIKNTGTKAIKLNKVQFTNLIGDVYEVAVNVEIPADGEWHTVRVNLLKLTRDGESVSVSCLQNIDDVVFVYRTDANATGTLYMDEILFAPTDSMQEDEPSDEPSDKPSDEPSDKPNEKPNDKPSNKPSENSTDDAVGPATGVVSMIGIAWISLVVSFAVLMVMRRKKVAR